MSEPDRPPPPLVVTLAALTVVSGFVDAVSFLGLGHVFTANMTGNVVLIGFAAAGAPGFSVAASLSALGAFLAGAVAGGRLAQRVRPRPEPAPGRNGDRGGVHGGRRSRRRHGARRRLRVASLHHHRPSRRGRWACATSAVRRVGVPDMSTTVLTTTLTGLASGSSLAGGTNPHARLGATTVLSMFGGALVGAVLVLHAGAAWSLGVAAGIVTVTAVFFYREVPLELT